MNKENGDSEALKNFKTEYMDEYVEADWNAWDIKHQILSADAFQGADSVGGREAKSENIKT